MEKRLLMFFAVTFVAVSLWPRIFPAPEPPEPTPETTMGAGEGAGDVAREETSEPAEADATPTPRPAGEDKSAAPEVSAPETETSDRAAREAQSEQRVVVATSLYEAELTNRGARLMSFRLQQFQDHLGQPYEMVGQFAGERLNIRPLGVRLEDSAQTASANQALFVTGAPSRVALRDGEERVLVLEWADGHGLEVTKRLSFQGGSYRVGVEVSVRSQGREIPKAIVYGAGIGDELAQSRYAGADAGVIAVGREVELFSAGDIEDGEGNAGNINAVGVSSHYFTALMVPERGDAGSFDARLEVATIQVEEERDTTGKRSQDDEAPELVDKDVITAHVMAPATPVELTLYVGPKKFELLQALGPGLEQIIDFGSWMRYPALVLRSWLLAIYDRVGNYGFAIVLLTVFINILLIPLKHYSFVSMRKMQKIAPQTQKIRERYKKVKPTDPRYAEMNQEMQALYKEHGVNPVSGCLPMLLMIPFFFAFYRMLNASIELRQAPFILWVDDLAVHDPYFVLPILMGGTQLLIQRMTPQTTADPTQAKIMSFMPILFTLILAGAPAGLVLYWFSNNLVSMAQQKITNRIMGDKDADDKTDKSKGGKGSKGDPVKSVKSSKKRKGKKGG